MSMLTAVVQNKGAAHIPGTFPIPAPGSYQNRAGISKSKEIKIHTMVKRFQDGVDKYGRSYDKNRGSMLQQLDLLLETVEVPELVAKELKNESKSVKNVGKEILVARRVWEPAIEDSEIPFNTENSCRDNKNVAENTQARRDLRMGTKRR